MTQIPRQVLLDIVADVHYQWVLDNEANTPFHPERYGGGSDYNQHSVDVEASAEQESDLSRRIEAAKAKWLAEHQDPDR